jgi:hypothetical protein
MVGVVVVVVVVERELQLWYQNWVVGGVRMVV